MDSRRESRGNSRKIRRMAVCIAAFAALAVPVTFASTASASNASTIIDGNGCVLLSTDSHIADTLFTDVSHQVQTTVKGNVLLSCTFTVPTADIPAKAVKNSGFPCGTAFGPTLNSRSVVDTEGNATLTCQIKGNA